MRMVAIGGGTGLSTLLRGLKRHTTVSAASHSKAKIVSITAIVTVTDEGGSSGRLRRDFRMLPPGDIRNCLVALAGDETLFAKLFDYRFKSGGGLRGHNFGNLFLTALTNVTHDFAKAVRVSSDILAVRGEIFPSTLADVHLKAKLTDGRTIYGESRIAKTHVPIARLSIVPARCKPLPEALAAIRAADLITVGPGSLYTSLIPNLLVQGIAEEIMASRALKLYIGNLMTQPGETRRYSAADHLSALLRHAGGQMFDGMVLSTSRISTAMLKRYASHRAEPVVNDIDRIDALGVRAIQASLLAPGHVARHSPERLTRLLLDLAAARTSSRRKPARLPSLRV
ncbi:MAG: uridine diphosphate-N-acetylglucosamine-binding protein YvcK [Acidobacteriota bacterium]|nr:uridine diphosphate-N-acetylglucosamine-binding protein YvcK [Acidobacteriota bacterium]